MRIDSNRKATVIADIKRKAQQVIFARYPQWKQNNLLAGGDAAAITEAWTWIDAVRAHSNELEAVANAGGRVELDSGWPQ